MNQAEQLIKRSWCAASPRRRGEGLCGLAGPPIQPRGTDDWGLRNEGSAGRFILTGPSQVTREHLWSWVNTDPATLERGFGMHSNSSSLGSSPDKRWETAARAEE